jgi:hypothetical protein
MLSYTGCSELKRSRKKRICVLSPMLRRSGVDHVGEAIVDLVSVLHSDGTICYLKYTYASSDKSTCCCTEEERHGRRRRKTGCARDFQLLVFIYHGTLGHILYI